MKCTTFNSHISEIHKNGLLKDRHLVIVEEQLLFHDRYVKYLLYEW